MDVVGRRLFDWLAGEERRGEERKGGVEVPKDEAEKLTLDAGGRRETAEIPCLLLPDARSCS